MFRCVACWGGGLRAAVPRAPQLVARASLVHTSAVTRHNTRQSLIPPKPKAVASATHYIDGSERVVRVDGDFFRFGFRPEEVKGLPEAAQHVLSMEMASQAEKTKVEVQKVMDQFQRMPNDTGSSEVQIAVLSTRIKALTEHLRTHPQDKHSLRGLQLLVGQRRRLMRYLRRRNMPAFRDVCARLGLRDVGDDAVEAPKRKYSQHKYRTKKQSK